VAVLASIAMPSYTAYLQRSKVPVGLDALSAYFTRMEQRYQDSGNYANGTTCGVALPTASNYTFSCSLATNAGLAYTATATGTGALAGYVYTINSTGTRSTTAHPKGTPSTACWTVRGKSCDA
jgi:type IV pilus assembly protein PilE